MVQVNHVFDKGLSDPDELLARYFTLTGWSEAVAAAGAAPVTVVQRFNRDAQLTHNGIGYQFTSGGAWAIGAAVAKLRPDIAHVNGLIFPARTWLLRRMLPRSSAIVVQNHSDGGRVGRSPRLRVAGGATRGAVDAFLFAADQHAAAWRQAGCIAPHQPTYQVMEASTDLRPLARPAAREETGVEGSPAVLWVGRLNANKDPLTILAAFDRFAAAAPAATLTMIYHSDEQLAAVRAVVDASRVLKPRVRLIGAVARARIAAFFSAADVFVLGSHHEGSGYSVMEACACGAVPVVTDIPTFRLLTGGVGALWRPGDAGECARALAAVASSDLVAERARLAEHFTRVLSWDAVGRRAMQIYREVVNTRLSALGTLTIGD